METLRIKGKMHDDLKRNGELWVRTDSNIPANTGKTIRISEDVIHLYQKMYDDNENYWKENNIEYVVVMKVADYVARTRRGFEEKGSFDRALPIDMMIEYENTIAALKDSVDEIEKEEAQSFKIILP